MFLDARNLPFSYQIPLVFIIAMFQQVCRCISVFANFCLIPLYHFSCFFINDLQINGILTIGLAIRFQYFSPVPLILQGSIPVKTVGMPLLKNKAVQILVLAHPSTACHNSIKHFLIVPGKRPVNLRKVFPKFIDIGSGWWTVYLFTEPFFFRNSTFARDIQTSEIILKPVDSLEYFLGLCLRFAQTHFRNPFMQRFFHPLFVTYILCPFRIVGQESSNNARYIFCIIFKRYKFLRIVFPALCQFIRGFHALVLFHTCVTPQKRFWIYVPCITLTSDPTNLSWSQKVNVFPWLLWEYPQ